MRGWLIGPHSDSLIWLDGCTSEPALLVAMGVVHVFQISVVVALSSEQGLASVDDASVELTTAPCA